MDSFTVLPKETFIKAIENSIDSKLFNSIIIKKKDGKMVDLLNDGEYSCASYVSGILTIFNILPKTRSTVKSLTEDLECNKNFMEVPVKNITTGDIIIWSKTKFKNASDNEHVGFAISKEKAISTNYKEKKIIEHHITFGISGSDPNRKINRVFRISLF